MSRRVLLLFAGVTLLSEPGRTQEERFWDWTELWFETTEYARRRDAVLQAIRRDGGGVLIVPGAFGVSHGETFRQLDDFMYFTGLELPNAVLVLDADAGRSSIYAPSRDSRFENARRPNDFPGRQLADDKSIETTAAIAILARDQLDTYLRNKISRGARLWVNAGRDAIDLPPTDFTDRWGATEMLLAHLSHSYEDAEIRNAFPHTARTRMLKSPVEIEVMRRAAELTADAIGQSAQSVRPGITERDLEATFEALCKRGGAARVPFAPIIKSGPNAMWPWRILAAHYERRNRAMESGDIVIFDVGCELHHYVSDVGRTFPVSGSFSTEQRRALTMVTTVSDSVIAAVRTGITLQELIDVGVAQIPESERKYMPTTLFFGHHLGLSSDDPYLPDVPLAPGMIFTIEPWYYNHDRNISVFIEDEILVTENGADVLTKSLPRSPEALEALMREHLP